MEIIKKTLIDRMIVEIILLSLRLVLKNTENAYFIETNILKKTLTR